MNDTNNQKAIINMIKQQLRTGDVLNESILDLYREIPRSDFTPEKYRPYAYSDMQIPLAHEQCMMTPLEEASILQHLDLQGDETILEIGTGSGYLTALLAKLSHKVISVDIHADFSQQAAENLKQHDISNVECITDDGRQGWMEKAPYNVIVLTGAISAITKGLKLQLMKGGKLFAVIGQSVAMHGMFFQLDNNDNWDSKIVFETSISPLIDKTKHQEFEF